MEQFTTHKILQKITPGLWHDRLISQPRIRRLAYGYGRVSQSVKKCLEIIGNGVVYDVGLFIGKSLKMLDDYFYENPEGREILKIPYNPY